jgi:hypothetical protein
MSAATAAYAFATPSLQDIMASYAMLAELHAATSDPLRLPTRVPSLQRSSRSDTAVCPLHATGVAGAICIGHRFCLTAFCRNARVAILVGSGPVMLSTVLQELQTELAVHLSRIPMDTAIPDEAQRVRNLITTLSALTDAYQTWQASGEDTPLTREPLELALRAVESCHDAQTSTTPFYDRVCAELHRTRVIGSTDSDPETPPAMEMRG